MRSTFGTSFILKAVLLLAVQRTAVAASDGPKVTTFPTGLRLVTIKERETRQVGIACVVRAGTATPQPIAGLGSLVSKCLLGAGTNLSAHAVALEIGNLGGSASVTCEAEYTTIRVMTNRAGARDALYLILQAVSNATLDDEAISRARAIALKDAQNEAQLPYPVADVAIRSAIYTDGPHRESRFGSEESLRRITPRIASDFYASQYTPRNTVISVVGDIDPAEISGLVEVQWAQYNRLGAAEPFASKTAAPPEWIRTVRRCATKTALAVEGFAAPGRGDEDNPAASVLATVIGGGKGSRLFRKLRDEHGLGYSVGADLAPLHGDSNLLVYVEFDPARVGSDGLQVDPKRVQQILASIVQSVVTEPPTDAEVKRAAKFISGQLLVGQMRLSARAAAAAVDLALEGDPEWSRKFVERVRSVTADQVRSLAARMLKSGVRCLVLPK